MTYDFPAEVARVIGPALTARGFVVDDVAPSVDEGGRRGAVVYYRRSDCRVQVYMSARDGR